MKLIDTNIPANFTSQILTLLEIEAEPEEVISIYQSIIASTGDFFKKAKKKGKNCLIYTDEKEKFISAAIVEYNKNEEEGQDNWNYYFTFDENDVKDVPESNKFQSNNSNYHAALVRRLTLCGLRINSQAYLSPIITIAMRELVTFLDQNAKPGEDVTVEEPGYFVASVTVEDDAPCKALLPDSEMKILIKDDAATEKAA